MSLVPSSVVRTEEIKKCTRLLMLETAGGNRIPVLGQVETSVTLTAGDGQHKVTLPHLFYVADIVTGPILGSDFLSSNNMTINFGKNVLCYDDFTTPLLFSSGEVCNVVLTHDVQFQTGQHEVLVQATIRSGDKSGVTSPNSLFIPSDSLARDIGILPACALVDGTKHTIPVRILCVQPRAKLRKGKILGTIEDNVDLALLATMQAAGCNSNPMSGTTIPSVPVDLSQSDLTSSEATELHDLLDDFADVFSRGEHDLGRTSLIRHDIPIGDARPKRQRNYRQPYHLRQEVKRQVSNLLEQGVVEESHSPWSSPVLLVPKKDGSYRFCVDFRGLNSVTERAEYPLPRVDECVESLAGSVVFTTLDLASGYWQVEVESEDRPKTAFSSDQGHFQFVTMPMGLCGAPATFQRLMDLVLRGLHWTSVLVYLDDIIIFAKSFREHQEKLAEVLTRLRGAGLKLKPSKCCFARPQVAFLGHIVSAAGVQTDLTKTEKVSEWPVPTNVSELRSFLGLASYYRRFVKDFAMIAAPLTDLTGKRKSFVWTEQAHYAFSLLKQKLCSTPILAYPIFDPTCPFSLKTDASDVGLGAIVTQMQCGAERVIAYGSRKLNPAEKNYSVSEREALAVVWGMSHFRQYLYGQKFLVLTDHRPITFLKTMKDPKGKFARWIQEVSSYDFDIAYKAGKIHQDADALSRYPEVPVMLSSATATTAATSLIADEDLVRKAQHDDPVLQIVINQVRLDQRPPFKGRWRNGALGAYRRVWHQLRLRQDVLIRCSPDMAARLVVPEDLISDVLRHVHDEVSAGHLGVEKTFHQVRERFYWPGYAGNVEKYVRSCPVCQERSGPVPKASAPLQPITVHRPFQMIAMDFLELPRSNCGNKYCLVVSDYYTRWPEAFALPDMQAATVARVLVDGIVCRHGVPDVIHSDRGGSFENAVIRQLCIMLGMQKVRTSPYHPESDGLVERLNRTLLQMLSKFVSDKPGDWDLWLSQILFAYRVAVQSSTSFTPFELLYGRKPSIPADHEFFLPKTTRFRDSRAYLGELQHQQRLAREVVEDRLPSAQDRQARYHRTVTSAQYAEGDHVMLHDPATRQGPAYKLARTWTGPYVVQRKVGNVNFRIAKVGDSGSGTVVHYNRLKPFHDRHEPDQSGNDSDHSSSADLSDANLTMRRTPAPSVVSPSPPPVEPTSVVSSAVSGTRRSPIASSRPTHPVRASRHAGRPARYTDSILY